MFADLACASAFSFLRGAAQPSDMVAEALRLGHAGIGLADRNSVAGVVRAYSALKDARTRAEEAGFAVPPFRLAVGARLVFADGTPDIVAYPCDRAAWGRLTRLLTTGNLRAEKGGCILRLADLLAYINGLLLIVMEASSFAADEVAERRRPATGGLAGAGPDAGNVVALGVEGEAGEACARITSPSTLLGAGFDRLRTSGGDEASGVEKVGSGGEAVGRGATAEVVVLDPRLHGDAVARGDTGVGDGKGDDAAALRLLATLSRAAPGRVWVAATMPRGGRDRRRLAARGALADAAGLPLIATNDPLYAVPEDRPLHDVVTCIRLGTTVAAAGRRLAANAERHLKSGEEMARLFADRPEAVGESLKLLSRIGFDLSQLAYEYPHEPVPAGWSPQAWLERLVRDAADARYPNGVPEAMTTLIGEEFALIGKMDYAYYFLTVHDVVKFARERGILCQGRGSAANSAVCYLLGITSVDPTRYNLLFSRFVSEERREPPDIDVDFEHERREEVMQYIYARYGRHRAGIVATVIHYRPRSTVREVGKALGLSEDVTARLVSTVWGSYSARIEERRFAEAGFDKDNPEIVRLRMLVDRLIEFPRHLSQHVGGFVLTQGRLDEMVPIHNAAMDDRTFIEWDKDDIDALGLMKVDVLALGMLTCIWKAFGLIETHVGRQYALETIPDDQPDVYDMLCTGDSVGVFQVESRAQMNMLPRLRPRVLYDLVVQVAIVRPGPIQGDMVHPYLRRRQGREKPEYPSPAPEHGPADELQRVLGKTLGVPLFQEQAMQLAIAAARFTPSEANQLRRAMATFRNLGKMEDFEAKMVEGMVARGYERDFAERCYQQIEGFGSYGFPESHALSFARLVYVSSYLKCRYPAVFCASILNSQPMGFYAPAQLVRDAVEHGVAVRPVDVNASDWDCGLEGVGGRFPTALKTSGGKVGGSFPFYPKRGRGVPLPGSIAGDARVPASGQSEIGPDQPLPDDSPGRRDGHLAVRLGFRQVDGFREEWARALSAARAAGGRFASIEDLARRAGLPTAALRLLADADACRSLGSDRREALWEVRRTPADPLPLFAAADARELAAEPDAALPPMPLAEQVATDYQTQRLSLKGHPMAFLRPSFRAEGVKRSADIARMKDGRRASVAGVVLVRQRPGKGNAIFVTLEDETGTTNLILWARTFEAYRAQVMAARLMLVHGVVQQAPEGITHLMVDRVEDRSDALARLTGHGVVEQDLSRADTLKRPLHQARHPREVRILPGSRDFH